MAEQEMKVKEITKGNGEKGYTIKLNEIEKNNHIDLIKTRNEPIKEFDDKYNQGSKNHLWAAKLGDLEVTFFLKDKHSETFMKSGGVDDKVRIKRVPGSFKNQQTGVEINYLTYEFEKVE